MSVLRAIDVCAGAGGWAVAARGLPIRIIAAFDMAEDCLLTYRENHPGTHCVCCDVTEFDFSRLAGEVDLILGGIPCESLSVARACVPVKESEIDSLHRVIDVCMALPMRLGVEWWCYEDVVAITKHLPPLTPYFVLNSALFSAQRRRRAYVGTVPPPAAPREADPRVFRHCQRPGPYRRSKRLNGRTPGRHETYGDSHFYPWYPNEKSPTVMQLGARQDHYSAAEFGDTWRQLEWQELATLQGFPQDYLFVGPPERVRKMVAQAVQIDTGRAILRGLCDRVREESEKSEAKSGG